METPKDNYCDICSFDQLIRAQQSLDNRRRAMREEILSRVDRMQRRLSPSGIIMTLLEHATEIRTLVESISGSVSIFGQMVRSLTGRNDEVNDKR